MFALEICYITSQYEKRCSAIQLFIYAGHTKAASRIPDSQQDNSFTDVFMANWFPPCFTPVTVSIVNLFLLLQGNKLLHIFPGRERYYWFILHNRRLWYQPLIQMSKTTAESWKNQQSKLQNITSLARDHSILCLNLYLWRLQRYLFALCNYLSCIFREIMMFSVSQLPTVWDSDWKYPSYSTYS